MRGDLVARQAVLYSVLVLALVLFATALSFADPSDGRASMTRLIGLVVGLIDSAPGQGWLIWGARALVVVAAVAGYLLVRTRGAIKAAGADPDEGVPERYR